MQDSFLRHVEDFESWKNSGYPRVKQETLEFIDNLLNENKTQNLWKHQLEGILRTIYAYEVLDKNECLLNIVTGGGKTAIIGAVIFWLKFAHNINKFIILTPNTIVRARLVQDFTEGKVFKKFGFTSEHNQDLLNELGLHVLEPGSQPQGMLDSGIILGNIQQLYSSHTGGSRKIAYFQNFIGDVAIFNDEAHNTPAEEYTNVLNIFSKKTQFRLDTTATPNRADGQEPDTEMIYYYDVASALEDGIIKSIVVYEPDVKLLKLTYTNPETGGKKDVTELDPEFDAAEKGLKPFHWILDDEPMKKQISIALKRHEEQKMRAKGQYRPILFIVTMSIKEGVKVKKIMEERFSIKTLLVTEESDDDQRKEAMNIGTFNSNYEAIVSVLMLREGWDVPQVATILLLRKFSSPVYGQQIIGRGLRKVIRKPEEREILSVVDHPRLKHDWLWKLVAVSKIKQGVTDEDVFSEEEDLPAKAAAIQRMVKTENIIKIPDPDYPTDVDFSGIDKSIPEDEIEKSWDELLDNKSYDRDPWTIKKTQVISVQKKNLEENKRMEIVEGPEEDNFSMSAEYPRDVLEDKFKQELLHISADLLREAGCSANLRGKLYQIMMKHVVEKIFLEKTLSDASDDDIKFAMYNMPQIKENFTKPIVVGIVQGS